MRLPTGCTNNFLDIFILFFLYFTNPCFYHILYMDCLISVKKLPKSLLISIIFKSIINVITIILTLLNINFIYFSIFICIIIFTSFYFSKYKEEYILTLLFINTFWFIISNCMDLNLLESKFNISNIYFVVNFNCNYDNLSSLKLFSNYDFFSKNLFDLKPKNFEFKFLDFFKIFKS